MRGAGGIALLLVAGATTGCDLVSETAAVAPVTVPTSFGVAGTSLRDDILPAGADLVIRFTAPVDQHSCGPRTVTAAATHRRRLAGARARFDGDELTIPAAFLRNVAVDGRVVLRIEGGASPCALRSLSGEPLPREFRIEFRVAGTGAADLSGPSLIGSRPASGARDVATGATVDLRFSEPVNRAAAEDAVLLRVNGIVAPARFRLSPDRRRAIVRPAQPLPPGALVSVDLHRSLADDAGNPLAAGSPARVEFRTRESRRSEIDEDFAFADFADPAATNCLWADADAAGLLVARCGATPLPCLSAEPTSDLGDRDEIRFQILVRGDELSGGLASALRLRITPNAAGAAVHAVRIDAGPAGDDVLDASFQANRERARLATVADQGSLPAMGLDEYLGGYVDVPFEQPLAVQSGTPLLLDVSLALEPGARLAACADTAHRALVRDLPGTGPLLPSACLMVSGASPVARSLWYDAGIDAPRWRAAIVETRDTVAGTGPVVEFQSAPTDENGRPDAASSSDWERDASLLPSWRFLRFRVRFTGVPGDGSAPALDRIVVPYDDQ